MMALIRKTIRFVLQIRKHENIEDGLRRKRNAILRKFHHKKFNINDLKLDLLNLGLKKDDVVIVHSSWRGMYALECTPSAFIDALLELIGKNGTLLMPCYGAKNGLLHICDTKSAAGILSETLRNKPESFRSAFPKFSMVAYGKNAKEITSEHIKSQYQFDELSPYYIASKQYNAKILLLGMGSHSHKISVFHCATYQCRNDIPFYSECFTKKCIGHIITNQEDIPVNYIDRADNCSNNKRMFSKLFSTVPKKIINKRGYSLVLFVANEAFDIAYNFCQKGGKLYKIHK